LRATSGVSVAGITPNHEHVVRRYCPRRRTLEDIADELNVSKERVRQIREAAEKKLREDFIVLALSPSMLSRR
jgi:RNA polymerase sigma factor FliA